MNRINRLIWFLVLMNGLVMGVHSQTGHLSKKISIHLAGSSIGDALAEISRAGQFRFSYDAGFVEKEKPVTIHFSEISVENVLKEIFGKKITIKEIGDHVILVRKENRVKEKDKTERYTLSGKIYNSITRQCLTNVTVYEVEKRNSSLTTGDGSYSILFPDGRKTRGICFSKAGFVDTVIFVNNFGNRKIDIMLSPVDKGPVTMISRKVSILLNTIDSLRFVNWLVPKITRVNSANLKVTTPRSFQVSLIPYLGSNWKVSGSITNRVSVNLLAGYSGGLKGVEIGGLNIDRNDIRGIQFGVLGNIVGGTGKGWQLGILFNYNISQFDGVQVGGLMNYSQYVDGVQIATLLNIAEKENSGIQIAGFINYATIVNGVQLGIINISNRVERGTPIGLFSYVKEGYHLFEFSGNEIFYGNLAFKSGTSGFYSFFQFGMGGDYKMQLSYGMGTIFTLKKKLSMNIDASAGFVTHPTGTLYHGLLLKFNPALEYRFTKHFALFTGPVYNYFLFSKGQPSATSRGLSTYDFYFKSTQNASIQMWLGGVIGVRF